MNKIIGGLLVIALLSKPSIVKADFIAYEIFRIQSNIIGVIAKELENEEKQDLFQDIDDLLRDNEENTRTITSLLKEKNLVAGKIQTMMELKAYAKTSFDEKQINSFTEFTNQYGYLNKSIAANLEKIENKKDLKMATNELLHNDSSLSLIYNELKGINEIQWEVMTDLDRIIALGEETLTII